MFLRPSAVLCDEQSTLGRTLGAELDAAAERYHQARHNYEAALELQMKPWFGQCTTANEAVRKAFLDLNQARAKYGAVLKAIANSYAGPEVF